MRLVLQRVSSANVRVDDRITGEIQRGLVALVGVEQGDGEPDVRFAANKTLDLRVFPDEAGKMNRSVRDSGGAVLAISQFTLLGDCRKGRRPAFTDAAEPATANRLYELYCSLLREGGVTVERGVFAADMQLSLVNDGPVTLLVDSRKRF